MAAVTTNYTDDNIRTLEGVQHVRLRPGMYIGRLGNGNNPGDGIYVLLKEIVDNSIDEAIAGYCRNIHVTINRDGPAQRVGILAGDIILAVDGVSVTRRDTSLSVSCMRRSRILRLVTHLPSRPA